VTSAFPELGPVAYLDSSALIKLVVPEPETAALRSELARWRRHASSALARTEVVRAAARVDAVARRHARLVVETLTLIAASVEILDRAADLEPPALRSLDALHLASALSLEQALGPMVTYDTRLAEAARAAGISVVAPGS
jgi:predicted nucleic acid-binding protein